jgi:hypothetical protein
MLTSGWMSLQINPQENNDLGNQGAMRQGDYPILPRMNLVDKK